MDKVEDKTGVNLPGWEEWNRWYAEWRKTQDTEQTKRIESNCEYFETLKREEQLNIPKLLSLIEKLEEKKWDKLDEDDVEYLQFLIKCDALILSKDKKFRTKEFYVNQKVLL